MLRSHLALAGCLTAALLSLAGCGGTTEEPPVPDETGLVPPARGPDKPGDGEGVVLAVDKLFLGESDREGNEDKNAWKEFGYNLDGKISSAGSTGLCKPVGTATASTVYPDGNQGIDNSFGKNIVTIIHGLAPNPSTEINNSIAEGSFTLMLSLENLGAEADYNPITGRLYVGASMGAAPKWDGTDMWPIVPEFLNDPTDVKSSKVVFDKSYLVQNTWVSGSNSTLNLSIAVAGYSLTLPISNAVITMDLQEDHKGAMNGTIAGILPTEQLISELKKIIGSLGSNLCSGSTVEGILNQIRQASDILTDGTQDPNKTCDGISVGIGFTAKQVKLGSVAEPAAPAEDPCAMEPSGS
jgi:hypothetical protein